MPEEQEHVEPTSDETTPGAAPAGESPAADVPVSSPSDAAPEPTGAGDKVQNTFDQAELDALFAQAAGAAAARASETMAAAAEGLAGAQAEMDALAAEMAAAVAAETGATVPSSLSPDAASGAGEPVTEETTASQGAVADNTAPYAPPDLEAGATPAPTASIDLLDDVELDVKIELGRTTMYIEDVLRLGVGSVVPLDKLAGDPVDIYVNDRLIARGEVLVLNDNFCVRINDIRAPIPELED